MSSKSFKIIIHCYNTFCCKGEFVCLVFVIGLPQAKLTIFPTFAIDEEKVQMVCGGHEAISECMFYPAGQENLLKPSDSCNFSITGANLIAWSQDKEISHVNISCYYTVHASRQNESSPHSERVSIRVRGTLFNHKLFARQINCFFVVVQSSCFCFLQGLPTMSSLPPITEGSPTRMTPNATFQGWNYHDSSRFDHLNN